MGIPAPPGHNVRRCQGLQPSLSPHVLPPALVPHEPEGQQRPGPPEPRLQQGDAGKGEDGVGAARHVPLEAVVEVGGVHLVPKRKAVEGAIQSRPLGGGFEPGGFDEGGEVGVEETLVGPVSTAQLPNSTPQALEALVGRLHPEHSPPSASEHLWAGGGTDFENE